MKKILSILLAACLLALCLPLPAAQAATSMRGDLYRLINQERVKAGLSALNANSYLNACSVVRIKELFQSPSHTRPDGRDWRTVLEDKNLPVDVAYSGEIWCGGYSTAASALEAFMNSPAHREILMDKNFNFMGVGHGVQNGADYWVVNFTRSSQLQPENDCFGEDDTPAPNPPSGKVDLSMYYGSVTMKDGKVLLSKDSPALKCWLHAPRGSYLASWSVTVTDEQKKPIFYSGECPEERTITSERMALSLMMWKEPENGALVYPSCRLEPGKSYYYRFDATVGGKTYSSKYIPFIVDGEPAAEEPVTLTLAGSTGSDGAVQVDADNTGLYANLSAPQGAKLTNVSLRIYSQSGARIGTVSDGRTGTVSQSPARLGFILWKTPSGNKLTYSNFSLTLGETYQYELAATVNGTVYTTPKGKFRLPAPEDEDKPTPPPDIPVTPQFTDIKKGDFFYDAVQWAVKNNITSGTTATTFSPGAPCDRGQIVTFLWRANGSPEPASARNPFVDVKSGDYYYKAVLWAKEQGVTSGTDAAHFSPSTPCTRGQAVTFLWRSNGKPAGSGSSFSDVKSGQFYSDAVKWATGQNITSGTSATTFSPGQSCTRGQIVTFLYRDKA